MTAQLVGDIYVCDIYLFGSTTDIVGGTYPEPSVVVRPYVVRTSILFQIK